MKVSRSRGGVSFGLLTPFVASVFSLLAIGHIWSLSALAQDAQEIVVGTHVNFPPYYSVNVDGQPLGYAIDVMNNVADRAGLTVKYKFFENGELMRLALENGSIDVIPSFGITEPRRETLSFTVPLETFSISYFVRNQSDISENDQGFSTYGFGAVLGNAASTILANRDGIDLTIFPDAAGALVGLLSGEIDVLAYPEPVFWKIARDAGVSDRFAVVGRPLVEIIRGMAIRKDNIELFAVLDRTVRDFNASSDYQELYVTWFGQAPPFWTVRKVTLTSIVLFGALLAMAGLWRHYSLIRLNRMLNNSEQRFRRIFEDGPLGMVLTNPNRRIIAANGLFCEMLGYSENELKELTFNDITHTDDRDTSLDRATKVFSGTVNQGVLEKRYIKKTGEIVWASSTVSQILGKGGSPLYGIGMIQDITDRKRAVDELARSKEQYEFAVSGSGEGLWDWNVHTGEDYLSPRWKAILGYKDNELTNVLETFIDALHPDDKERAETASRAHLENRVPYNLEYRLRHKDGSYVWVSAKGQAIWDDDSQPLRMAGSIRDISEQKEMEGANTRLGRIVEQSLTELYMFDAKSLKFVQVNHGARVNLGYTLDELKELRPVDINPEFTDQMFTDLVKPLRERTLNQLVFENVHHRKDGSTYNVEVHLQLMQDEMPALFVANVVDITKRLEAETAIHESEQLYRRVFEDGLVGIVLSTPDRKIIAANQSFCQMLGYTEKELVELGLASVTHPDDNKTAIAIRDKSSRNSASPSLWEKRFITKNGDIVWAKVSISKVRNQDGTVQYGIGMVENITERKFTADALAQSEGRLRAVINHSPSLIVLKDLDGRLILANRTFEEWYGVKPGNWFGKTDYEFMPKDRADAVRVYDRQVLSSESALQDEIELPYGDGLHHVVEFTKFPVRGENGKILGVGSVVNDVTDRRQEGENLKKSEARLSAIINNSPDLIILKDPDGKLLLANKTFEEWHAKGDGAWHGETDWDIFPKEMADVVHALDKEALATNSTIHQEMETELADGRIHKLKVAKFPVSAETGEILGVGTISSDVTQLRAAEGQLRQAQKMEAVGQLTAGVAHEFNNLLGIMIGNAELLGPSVMENERAQHSVKAITKAVDRGANLTERLLAFSRKQILSPQPTEIGDLMLNFGKMIDSTLGETIDLRIEVTPDLWLAYVDPPQLEHALVNLAINARDAMPDGGSLAIEAANITLGEARNGGREKTPPGDYILITVTDTGSGVSPENLDKVFEPFFTTKDIGEGTGLGLSMVYGFVKQSKGHVTISSDVGVGTTFELYLPRSLNPALKNDPRNDDGDSDHGSGCILIVEDDADLRELPATLLRDQGYAVVEARDGDEAIKQLASGRSFNLVFTDIVLPGGMNGFEIAKEANRLQPGIKVIYTSGYAENTIEHEFQLETGPMIVKKPYRKAELLERVRAELANEVI